MCLLIIYKSRTYLTLNDPEKALEDAETGIKINPAWPKVFFNKSLTIPELP